MKPSRMGSSLSTLLFSLPLTAVALIAVFGVPQLAPLVASGEDESLFGNNRFSNNQFNGEQGRNGRGRRSEQPIDEFPEFSSSPVTARSQGDRPSATSDSWWQSESLGEVSRNNASTSREQSAVWNTGSGRGAVSQSPQVTSQTPALFETSSELRTSVPGQGGGGAALDWQSAARRLTEMGVERFHLERGHQEGTFLFVCLFQPATSPQLVRRFEAEAPEPLEAVNRVLRQIDDWLKQQYAVGGTSTTPATQL